MTNRAIIRILKVVMTIGFLLILLGIYMHLFSNKIEEMQVTGIIISACCVAVGMILSLPTKMFLTFVLMNRELESDRLTKDKKLK